MTNEDDFIDFNDIMNNKKQPNVDSYNIVLSGLSNSIDDIYNSGVPVEAINDLLMNKAKELAYRALANKEENQSHK